MKKLLLFLVAASLILASGCNKEDVLSPIDELEVMMKASPPGLFPAPITGDVYTLEELESFELSRIENEAMYLETADKGLPGNGTYEFARKCNVSKSMNGIVIYDNTSARAEIVGGGITFAPEFVVKFNVASGLLQSAEAFIHNTATANPTFKVTAKKSFTNTWAKNLYKWTQTSWAIVWGVVPVWVTWEFQIDGGCYVSAAASGWIQQNVSVSSYVKIGAKWVRNQGWANISNLPSPSYSMGTPSYSWNASLTIQPYLNAFLTAKLYSVVGPRLLVSPYYTLYLNASSRYIDRTASLRGHAYFSLYGLNTSTLWNQQVFLRNYSFPRIYF